MARRHITLYIKLLCGAIALFGILGYSYWRSADFIKGPELIITNPRDGATMSESFVLIEGTAKNTASAHLNGKSIFIDEEGTLREELLLMYGYNIIELRAQDKFGRETVKTLRLVYR